MSPNSMWPSARALYERYREHVGLRRAEERADSAARVVDQRRGLVG